MERFSDLPEEIREKLLIRLNVSLINRIEEVQQMNRKLLARNDKLSDKLADYNNVNYKDMAAQLKSKNASLTKLKHLNGQKKTTLMEFIDHKGLFDEYEAFCRQNRR